MQQLKAEFEHLKEIEALRRHEVGRTHDNLCLGSLQRCQPRSGRCVPHDACVSGGTGNTGAAVARWVAAQVCRLEALVEAERLQFSLTENRLQQMLVDEQLRSERMRLVSEDALSQK